MLSHLIMISQEHIIMKNNHEKTIL